MSMNRRTLFAGATACAVVPALPAAAEGTRLHLKQVAAPPDLAEAIAIFRDLNPERRARKLADLRDCLAAQRLFERDKAGGRHA